MQVYNFLKYFAWGSLLLSTLFLVDILLPKQQIDTVLVNTFRPVVASKGAYYRSTSHSYEKVFFETADGRISIYVSDTKPVASGDKVRLYKSLIFRINRGIYLEKYDYFIKGMNPLYGWMIFLPMILLLSSLFTLFKKESEVVENLGSANIVITGFFLYIIYIML